MTRAANVDELQPLLELCRAGKLFDVQQWIQQGRAVALPSGAATRRHEKNPLRVAMDKGFHSLVQVLLEAGASSREGNYDALEHAVSMRRPDLASLLIDHGADVGTVSMRLVVEMWEPEMVELFIANGASLVRDSPVAWGLIHKVRPTLGLLKRYAPDQPELMRQADIALRFHAGEGNVKWVALMLWAGADPLTGGPDDADGAADDGDEEGEGLNAIDLAIIGGKSEILTQKNFLPAPDPARPETLRMLESACHAPDSAVLSMLLKKGHSPRLLADRGTSAITSLVHSMTWEFSFLRPDTLREWRSREGIDSSHARERMKMLHMLVAHGAKWLPTDKRVIGDVRRSLVKNGTGLRARVLVADAAVRRGAALRRPRTDANRCDRPTAVA